jgi:hypothetical protein
VELQEEYRLQGIERLVKDLGRVGDSRESLLTWLGHPIERMTLEEYATLSEYVTRAEEAVRHDKPTPLLPPMQRE